VAGRLSALTGLPWSFTAHAHDVFTEWDRVEQKLAAARFAVVPCEYTRRFVAERAPRQAEKLRVVPCGVDLDEFRRERPYDPEGPIVAVGRLVEHKGFADLVRAAAGRAGELPEVLIAGEGRERPALERLIAETGARVRLLGALPHDEVRVLWESASLAAVPCVVARDGVRDSVPVALREAMALELPIVATDEVGIPEAAGPRAALVPPRAPEALGAELARVAALPADERRAMGAAGRAHVAEQADLRRETARLLAMFELDGPSPAPVAVPVHAR
jgi:glycosyltransferase involved in cell wall biosynthesis